MRSHFRPEFINRIDEFIVFKALQRKDIKRIVILQAKRVEERLHAKKMKMKLLEPAIEFLAVHSFIPYANSSCSYLGRKLVCMRMRMLACLTHSGNATMLLLLNFKPGSLPFQAASVHQLVCMCCLHLGLQMSGCAAVYLLRVSHNEYRCMHAISATAAVLPSKLQATVKQC